MKVKGDCVCVVIDRTTRGPSVINYTKVYSFSSLNTIAFFSFLFLFNRVTKFLLNVTFRGTFSVMLAAGC